MLPNNYDSKARGADESGGLSCALPHLVSEEFTGLSTLSEAAGSGHWGGSRSRLQLSMLVLPTL